MLINDKVGVGWNLNGLRDGEVVDGVGDGSEWLGFEEAADQSGRWLRTQVWILLSFILVREASTPLLVRAFPGKSRPLMTVLSCTSVRPFNCWGWSE